MEFQERELTLRDGRQAVLRKPTGADGAEMAACMGVIFGETPFLLRDAEDWNVSPEAEAAILETLAASETSLMLAAVVEGKLVGNCSLSLNTKRKIRHRASFGISILRAYWGLGLGTAMIRALIDVARDHGVEQLELECIEGNDRARALYEKLGFRIAGLRTDAFRMQDGSSRSEYWMILRL